MRRLPLETLEHAGSARGLSGWFWVPILIAMTIGGMVCVVVAWS